MALWHYTFSIVPKIFFDKRVGDRDLYDVYYEDDLLWKNTEIRKEIFKPVEKFLPLSKSWSKHRFIYGEEGKSHLSVLVEDDGQSIVSVSLRISFVENNFEVLLQKLVSFFIENDFYIISEDFHGFLPEFDAMIKEILQSSRISTYTLLSNPKLDNFFE